MNIDDPVDLLLKIQRTLDAVLWVYLPKNIIYDLPWNVFVDLK